jgi:transposase
VILELIDTAMAQGARLSAATAIAGLSARTVIRWRRLGDAEDRRKGPSVAPANKLTEQERMRIVDVANSAPFRDMSPKQIVPQLADKGIFIGSESSFYRVLKEHQMVNHRQPCQLHLNLSAFHRFKMSSDQRLRRRSGGSINIPPTLRQVPL